jgi:hypothetical protein
MVLLHHVCHAVVLMQAMFVMSILNYSELTYETSWNTYVYPQWAVSVGWAFGCFAVLITPLFGVYKIIQYRVFLRKVCHNINLQRFTRLFLSVIPSILLCDCL